MMNRTIRGSVFFLLPALCFIWGCWVTGSIHTAAKEGKRDVVQRWLAISGDLNERDSRGSTPLHCAVENGHRDIAEMLLNKGAEIDAVNDLGNTPLHEAAWKGHIDLVKFLIEKGARADIRAVDGKTARDLAEKNSRTDIIEFFRHVPVATASSANQASDTEHRPSSR